MSKWISLNCKCVVGRRGKWRDMLRGTQKEAVATFLRRLRV